MNYHEYSQLSGVNFSTLKHIAVSPKHYRHWLANPKPASPAMRLGNAIHTYVLEPANLLRDCVEYNAKDKKGNQAKRVGNQWKEFSDQNKHKTILTPADIAKCEAVRNAVLSHPEARKILTHQTGLAEQTVRWTDKETGLACKCRVDWYDPMLQVQADLKSTNRIDPFWFGRTVKTMHYLAQCAFYAAGLKASLGLELPQFIIAVEQTAPFDTAVYALTEEQFDEGETLMRSWLRTLAECREADMWPGQCEGYSTLLVPQYGGDELAEFQGDE